MSNEWFERGELPPVGTECECFDHGFGYFVQVKILDAASEREIAVVSIQDGLYVKLFWGSEFRPIRAEREKAIEAAMNAHPCDAVCNRDLDFANALYDAGLLRLPEDKK